MATLATREAGAQVDGARATTLSGPLALSGTGDALSVTEAPGQSGPALTPRMRGSVAPGSARTPRRSRAPTTARATTSSRDRPRDDDRATAAARTG